MKKGRDWTELCWNYSVRSGYQVSIYDSGLGLGYTAMTTDWEINRKLFEAVEANDLNSIRRSLARNADINAKNRQGSTPLHIAVESYRGDTVRFLMLNGADMHIEDSSRRTAVDIARSNEYTDIFQLLTMMDSTTWRPGDDPDLLLTYYDKEFDNARSREMLIQERSQIEQILQDAGLHHLYSHFERNKISYIQFLRLDDHSLKEIGITDADDRGKIADIVNDRADRKWQETRILPNFMHKFVTSAETTCMLKNLQSHLDNMSTSVSFVRTQQARNPEMLLHNLEGATMNDVTLAINSVAHEADNLIEAVGMFLASTEDNSKESKESDSGLPFVTVCIGIAALNGFLWGLGTVLYLRYRQRL
ncbi:unnamed protein product [Allacma fusca]|uniref:SAM domain-containing protein n=1 Tax=Allacma fusca TaxID=39272 RepID=A0A8J2LDE5_9HEXA|nr:unnamed protein product [Allacma fusca]